MQYVKCNMCGFAWTHKGNTFCARCGKAIVVAPPQWYRGSDDGKPAPWHEGNRSGNDKVSWDKRNRWEWRTVRGKHGGAKEAKSDAVVLLDSLAKVEGFTDAEEIAKLRERLALQPGGADRAEEAAAKAKAAKHLEALAKLGNISALPEFKALCAHAEVEPAPAPEPAKSGVSPAQLERNIAHKLRTQAAAAKNLEYYQLGLEKAQADLQWAKTEFDARTAELAELQAKQTQANANIARRTLFGDEEGVPKLCAAHILPESLASSAKYRNQISVIQNLCDKLLQEAQREQAEAVAPDFGMELGAAEEVPADATDTDDLDNLMGELDELEPEAKRKRIQQLVDRATDRVRPTRPQRTQLGRSQPPAARDRNDRSRSPVVVASVPPAAAASPACAAGAKPTGAVAAATTKLP